MQKIYKKISALLQAISSQIKEEWRVKYRIVEFNLKAQKVVMNVKRRSLILKYHFADVIKEIWLIEALSSVEAGLLGYYYGRCYRLSQTTGQAIKKLKPSPLLLKKERGRYKILSHNRDGNIGYVDSRNRQKFSENPVSIMQNFHVLRHFDSTQACYIGILAGLNYEKVQTIKLKPSLRVVE